MIIGYSRGRAVQTFGTFGSASTGGGGRSVDGTNGSRAGFGFTALASSSVIQVRINVQAITTADTWEARIYTYSGSSPGTQVGSASTPLSISTTGNKTFVFPSPPSIINATNYWLVFVPTASASLFFDTTANNAAYDSGRNNVIASITNNLPSSEDWRVEVSY